MPKKGGERMRIVKFKSLVVEMAKAGESQADLCKILRLSAPSISRRFSGEIKWNEKEKKKLSKHYNVDVKELFKEEN